jgi:hypothetical protein
MKILYDARPIIDAPHGGVGRVALSQAKKLLSDTENEVIFFTTGSYKPQLPPDLLGSHSVHKHINMPNKVWSLLCIFGLRPLSWFVKEKPDMVLLPNIGFIGAPASWKTHLIVHDVSFLIEPKWFRFKQRLWHRFVRPKFSTTAPALAPVPAFLGAHSKKAGAWASKPKALATSPPNSTSNSQKPTAA